MAFQVLPHTCVFFESASEMLLQLDPICIPAIYRKGYSFGFLLSSLMVDLFKLSRESSIPQKDRRWGNYWEPVVPIRQQWEDVCHETMV
jgi:hypothetical protein